MRGNGRTKRAGTGGRREMAGCGGKESKMTVAGPERASTARMPAEEMQRTSQRASGRAGGVEDCSKSAVQCSAAGGGRSGE